jgi:hypothetical protein
MSPLVVADPAELLVSDFAIVDDMGISLNEAVLEDWE